MNIYLISPTEEIHLPDFDFVCETCHEVNRDNPVVLQPTLDYKITQGLLQRKFKLIEPTQLPCKNCGVGDNKTVWLFHIESQPSVELHQIIALQKEHSDSSHHVFQLPEFDNLPS